jgi:glycosyltransferase involved in cell wall biosynthesis
MKVLHVCVCGPFTDGLAYQENELIEQHMVSGHAVTVIAATETYGPDKHVVHANPGVSMLRCGATLIRLPYVEIIPRAICSKLRAHGGLWTVLRNIRPDRILFHGLTAWDLLVVAEYARRTPGVKLFADCHEDFNNSARTWASRELLHKCFYRPIFRRCVDSIVEVLCVTPESLDFAIDFYGSPPAKTSLYPLGCAIEAPGMVSQRRAEFRAQRGFSESDIVITQTGKLDHTKKLAAALRAFRSNPTPALKFIIAGRMSDEVMTECLPLMQGDERISDLGWQSSDELRNVLAGADCFLQPFGQTVTTQMAMGYGCVVLAQDLPSHRWLVGDNGCLFKDASELDNVLQWVVCNQRRLAHLKKATAQFAADKLDYRKLALKIVA